MRSSSDFASSGVGHAAARQRSAGGRRARRLAAGLALALGLACNALTGVGDLEFSASASGRAEPAPRGGGSPLPPPCDPLTGDGCGPGQTCRLNRESAAPECEPAPAASLEPYSRCDGDAQCPAAFLCVAGVCSKLCETAADCGWPNARCLSEGEAPFKRCSRNCDLVSSDDPRAGLQACGADLRCDSVAESAGSGYTDCFPAVGLSFIGGVCQVHSDCPVGSRCQDQRCARACGPNEATCPSGLACGGVSAQAGQQVGGCCSVPEGQACNLVTDCGCGAGEVCWRPEPGPTLTTACRPLPADPLVPYAACDRSVDCPARHSCIGGLCKRHCNELSDCGSERDACRSVTNEGSPIAGYSVCSRSCDPLSPAAPRAGLGTCGPGAGCGLYTTGSDCISSGSAVAGSSCESDADCASGLDCFGNVCRRWCDPSVGGCGAGEFCGNVLSAAGLELGRCCQRPAGQACDWATDCGCQEAQTCALNENDVPFCRVVNQNTVAPFAACNVNAECPPSHECALGNCVEHCTTSADCSTGTECFFFLAPEELPGVGLCARNCDVLAPTSSASGFQPCPPGLGCLDDNGDVGGLSICYLPGAVAAGGACTFRNDCALGLDCEGGVCMPVCEIGTAGCPNGAACAARAVPILPIAGRTLGICPTPAAPAPPD